MKTMQFRLTAILFAVSLFFLTIGCKQVELNSLVGNDGKAEIQLGDTQRLYEVGDKQVKFNLGTYASVLPDFRDTALKSLEIMSAVLSSKEFKDSIIKYDFPCTNAWFSYNICANPGSIIVNKCDSAVNKVHGTTVYDDYLMEDTVTLNLNILTNTAPNPSSLGFSDRCIYQINTYSYWLTNNRTLPLSQEYAIHLAHEYGHVLGYYHSTLHSTSEDVCYRIGGIVRNILWRWHLEELKETALHTVFLTIPKYRFLAVNPPTMPQSGGFDSLLQADIVNTQAVSRSYNHFYLDFNPPSGQRVSGSNVVFGVTTTGSGYWIEYNYYLMEWVDESEGIFKFTYKANNGSNSTTRTFSENLRGFFQTHTFKIDYSDNVLTVGKVMGRLICVEDPSKFFYGQFESSWSNW